MMLVGAPREWDDPVDSDDSDADPFEDDEGDFYIMWDYPEKLTVWRCGIPGVPDTVIDGKYDREEWDLGQAEMERRWKARQEQRKLAKEQAKQRARQQQAHQQAARQRSALPPSSPAPPYNLPTLSKPSPPTPGTSVVELNRYRFKSLAVAGLSWFGDEASFPRRLRHEVLRLERCSLELLCDPQDRQIVQEKAGGGEALAIGILTLDLNGPTFPFVKPPRASLYNHRTRRRDKPTYPVGQNELLYQPWIRVFSAEGSSKFHADKLAGLEAAGLRGPYWGMDKDFRERAMWLVDLFRSHPTNAAYARALQQVPVGLTGSSAVAGQTQVVHFTITRARVDPETHNYREDFTTVGGNKGYRYHNLNFGAQAGPFRGQRSTFVRLIDARNGIVRDLHTPYY